MWPPFDANRAYIFTGIDLNTIEADRLCMKAEIEKLQKENENLRQQIKSRR